MSTSKFERAPSQNSSHQKRSSGTHRHTSLATHHGNSSPAHEKKSHKSPERPRSHEPHRTYSDSYRHLSDVTYTSGRHTTGPATSWLPETEVPSNQDPDLHAVGSQFWGTPYRTTQATHSATTSSDASRCPYHSTVFQDLSGRTPQSQACDSMGRFIMTSPSEQPALFMLPGTKEASINKGCTCYNVQQSAVDGAWSEGL